MRLEIQFGRVNTKTPEGDSGYLVARVYDVTNRKPHDGPLGHLAGVKQVDCYGYTFSELMDDISSAVTERAEEYKELLQL